MLVDKLKIYSKILLDDTRSDDQLEVAIKQLAPLFEEYTFANKKTDESFFIESSLSNGLALSPNKAAKCVLEPLRVAYFLRGVYKAINDTIKSFSNPIHILYAGSGPYGTLIVPLLPFFSSKEIQVSILDYHQLSLDSVKSIVESFGFAKYIKEYIQADASIYKHPKNDTLHMIISETMTAALQKEMQVPITLNLAPQLIKGGVFIPENIAIKAIHLNSKDAFIKMGSDSTWDKDQIFGTVFEINKQKGVEHSTWRNKNFIPANKIIFPEQIQKDVHPFLLTDITIYEDIKMDGFQCSLNYLLGFPGEISCKANSKVEFIYNLGENPGLSIKREYENG
jgi:hypothetical protein